ncbi:MAG: TIGR00296 family protein [Candidatus Altiarchaeota archaeon]
MTLTQDEGRDLVAYARAVLEANFGGGKPQIPPSLEAVFQERLGVFVTLQTKGELRGCIGFPEPSHPLGYALEHAALSAALEDPRFPPVGGDELSDITVEVSVLTRPELMEVADPGEYAKRIRVGCDGLIAELGWSRGLLLPQVPVEWKWDAEEFLMQTCNKADLPLTAYMEKGFKLYSFQAQIFHEERPRGNVVEHRIS